MLKFTTINITVQAELTRERHGDAIDSEITWDQHAVQGTCSNLEKKYFRLTGPPNPNAVRPPHVLKAALDHVVRRYRAGQCDIHYAEDQLKAMRQDVTVQHVRGELPVQIYEAHARACLEHGNGGDFNQCQTQLKALYEDGSPGSVQEFVAYRVLYQSILRSKESASLLATLQQLSPQVGCFCIAACLLLHSHHSNTSEWRTPASELVHGQFALLRCLHSSFCLYLAANYVSGNDVAGSGLHWCMCSRHYLRFVS